MCTAVSLLWKRFCSLLELNGKLLKLEQQLKEEWLNNAWKTK